MLGEDIALAAEVWISMSEVWVKLCEANAFNQIQGFVFVVSKDGSVQFACE